MPDYKVTWTVEVTAPSPLMAALVAEEIQAGQTEGDGGVFNVEGENNVESEEIDLSKLELSGIKRHVMALKEISAGLSLDVCRDVEEELLVSEPHRVSEPTKYLFLVMDGRAEYDFDEAAVIEVMADQPNYERQLQLFRKRYHGYAYCLFAAQKLQGNVLGDPVRIRNVEDLEQLK